jgi:hypothetical protein
VERVTAQPALHTEIPLAQDKVPRTVVKPVSWDAFTAFRLPTPPPPARGPFNGDWWFTLFQRVSFWKRGGRHGESGCLIGPIAPEPAL